LRGYPLNVTDASAVAAYDELFALTVEEARRRGIVVTDATPPARRACVVDGLRLHFLDWRGEHRPPMLLLHGRLLTAHVWDLFNLEMRRQLHIRAVDLPGHGDSQWAADADYSRARNAAAIVGLIEQLDLPPMVLVGHSFGGSIAALVAGTVPNRVRALVLVDTTLLPAGRSSFMAEVLAGPPTFASLEDFARYAAGLSQRPRDQTRVSDGVRWNARQLPDGRWTWKYDPALRQLPPGRESDFSPIWSALRAFPRPILFVRAGEQSHLSDEAAERLQMLPNVRLVVPDSRHNVMRDNPIAFRRMVAEFLSSVGGSFSSGTGGRGRQVSRTRRSVRTPSGRRTDGCSPDRRA
jgi:pimeloyl-ACP methyl ester carboxylesterase